MWSKMTHTKINCSFFLPLSYFIDDLINIFNILFYIKKITLQTSKNDSMKNNLLNILGWAFLQY